MTNITNLTNITNIQHSEKRGLPSMVGLFSLVYAVTATLFFVEAV